MGGTEKPLFLLRALPQKNSDFAVLIADAVNLELLVWHPPGARAIHPPGVRAGASLLALKVFKNTWCREPDRFQRNPRNYAVPILP